MDSKEPDIEQEITEFFNSQNSINKHMEDTYDEFTAEYNQSMSELHQLAKKHGFESPNSETSNLLPAEDAESKITLALTELNLFKMSISASKNPELNRLTRDNIVGHILILDDIGEDQKEAFVDMVNELLQDHIDALVITPDFIEAYRERMDAKHNNQLISTGLRTAVN